MPSTDPRERSEHARLAAYASWRNTSDRPARTAAARQAALAKRELQHAEAERKEKEARARLRVLQARRHLAQAAEDLAVAEGRLRDLGLVAE